MADSTDLPSLTLVSHRLCPYAQRAAIVLAEKGLPFTRRDIDLAAKPDWFLALSPLGKVPLLQVGETTLFESAVICDYLDEATPGALHPADPLIRAQHRGWIEFGSSLLDAIAGFYAARDAETFTAKQATIRGKLAWLERHLSPGPWFAGPRFHMVDAVYGPVFRYFDAFERIADFGFFEGLARVTAWRAALAARPSIRGAVAAEYPDRLLTFLETRGGRLSALITHQVKTASTPV